MHKTSKLLLAILVIAVAVSALAACVDPTFKVTFRLYGDETDVVEVAPGKTVEKPADPTRTNYVFAGWYADGDFTEVFDFDRVIEKDTDVYAKWTPVAGSEDPNNPNNPNNPNPNDPNNPDNPGPAPETPALDFNDEGWIEFRTTGIGVTIADSVSPAIRELLTGDRGLKTKNSRFGEISYSNEVEYMSKLSEKIAEKYFVFRFCDDGRVIVYCDGLYDEQSNRANISYGIENGTIFHFYANNNEEFSGVVTETGMKLTIEGAYTYSDLLDAPLPEEENYVVEGVSQYMILETIDNSKAYDQVYGKVYTLAEPHNPSDLEFASHDYAFLAQYDDQRFSWHQYGNRVYVNIAMGEEESPTLVIDITEDGMSATFAEDGGMTVPLTYKSDAPVYETVEGQAFSARDGDVKIQFLTNNVVYIKYYNDEMFATYFQTGKYIILEVEERGREFEVVAVRKDAEDEIKFGAVIDNLDETIFSVDTETEIATEVPKVAGKEYELNLVGKYVITNQAKFNEFVQGTGKGPDGAVAYVAKMIMGEGSDGAVVSFYTDGKMVMRNESETYTLYGDIMEFVQYADKISMGYYGIGMVDDKGNISLEITSSLIGFDTSESYGFTFFMGFSVIDGSSVGNIENTANGQYVYGTVWEVDSVVANFADNVVLILSSGYSIAVAEYKADYKSEWENQQIVFYRDSYMITAVNNMQWTPTASRFVQIGKYILVTESGNSRISYTVENDKLVYIDTYHDLRIGDESVELVMTVTLKKATIDDPENPFFNLDTTPDEFITSEPDPGPGPGPGPDPVPNDPEQSDYVGYRFNAAEIVEIFSDPENAPAISDDEIREKIIDAVNCSYVEIVTEPETQDVCTFISFNDGRRQVKRVDYNTYVSFDEDRTTIVTYSGFDVSYIFDGVRYYAHVQVKFAKTGIEAEYDFSYPVDTDYDPYRPMRSEYMGHRFTFGEIVEMTDVYSFNDEQPVPDEDALRAAAEQVFSGTYLEFVADSDNFYYSYYLYNDGAHQIATLDFGIPYEVTYDENETDIIVYRDCQYYFNNQSGYCMFRVKFVKSGDDATFEIGAIPEDIAGTYVAEDGETAITIYEGVNHVIGEQLTVDFNGVMQVFTLYGSYLKNGIYILYRYEDGRLIPFSETFSEQDDEYWFGYVGSINNQTFTKTDADPIPVLGYIDGKTFRFDVSEPEVHWNVRFEDDWYLPMPDGEDEDVPTEVTDFLNTLNGFTVSFNDKTATVEEENRQIGHMFLNGVGFDISCEDDPIVINGYYINLFYEAFSEQRLMVRGYNQDSEMSEFIIYLSEVQN